MMSWLDELFSSLCIPRKRGLPCGLENSVSSTALSNIACRSKAHLTDYPGEQMLTQSPFTKHTISPCQLTTFTMKINTRLTATELSHFGMFTLCRSTDHSLTLDYRYWYDATYYKPGGPVITLCSGESPGPARLPYLQKGIVYQLAKATNGIGVILEHRYYGTSFPVPDLSVENLRFLTTEQALADTAYFAENIVFEGLEDLELTASDAPWIVYGGSYAGAFVVSLLSCSRCLLIVTYVKLVGFSPSTLP
jgi:hypothetical protein